MRIMICALPFLASCGCGGAMNEGEARVVVGIEPQEVPVALFAERPTWVSLRADGAEVSYPLGKDGAVFHVESGFAGDLLGTYFEPWGDEVTGALAVPLTDAGADDGESPEREYRGELSLVIGGDEGETAAVPVTVRPALDPCAWDDDQPPEARPRATLDGAATCVDGTACTPPGTRVDSDERTFHVTPFQFLTRVQRIWIQVAC
jgi:hypothetical protein